MAHNVIGTVTGRELDPSEGNYERNIIDEDDLSERDYEIDEREAIEQFIPRYLGLDDYDELD